MSIRNMNIAPRAFLGFAFIALLVIALGFFAPNRMTLIRQATVDMETNTLPSISLIGNINESVLRLRVFSLRILINREPEMLQESDQRIAEVTAQLQAAKSAYSALPAEADERAIYQQFDGTLTQYLSLYSQAMQLSREDKVEETRAMINTGMRQTSDLMTRQLKELVDINKASAIASSKVAGQQYDGATVAIIAVAIIASLMTVLLAWLLTRSIVAPLSRAVTAAQEIAAGNLTKQIVVDGKDEPARLGLGEGGSLLPSPVRMEAGFFCRVPPRPLYCRQRGSGRN